MNYQKNVCENNTKRFSILTDTNKKNEGIAEKNTVENVEKRTEGRGG